MSGQALAAGGMRRAAGRTVAICHALALYFFDRLVRPRKRPSAAQRALIVRTDNIGDYVLWRNFGQGLIDSLHSQGYSVTLLASDHWADFAAQDLAVDEVLAIDRTAFRRNLLYRARFVRRLGTSGFSQVFHPVFSRDFIVGDALVLASQATQKIGFDGDLANRSGLEKRLADTFYTQLVAAAPASTHELLKNADFLAALGLPRAPAWRPVLHGKPVMETLSPPLPARFIVVAPGSSWAGKQWPIERFVAAANHVKAHYGWAVIIVGGRADVALGDLIAEETGGSNLCGKTSLAELATIIAQAKLLLTNDMSAVHFGFAQTTPTVCILGGGHFGRFLPFPEEVSAGAVLPVPVFEAMDCFGCDWKCTRPHDPNAAMPCITAVTTQAVIHAIDQTLAGTR